MASSLFPELPKRTTSHLLRKIVVPAERRYSTRQRTLASLVNLGILQIQWRPYVRCREPRDPDFTIGADIRCTGQIAIAIDNPEGQTDCPNCGRWVDPSAKLHFLQYGVQIDPQGVKRYLQDALQELEVVSAPPRFTDSQNYLSLQLPDGEESHLFLFDYVGPVALSDSSILFVVCPHRRPQPAGQPHLSLLDFLSESKEKVGILWREVRPVPEPTMIQLYKILCAHFSHDDLRLICVTLQVPRGSLRDDTRDALALDLVEHLKKRKRIADLVNVIRKERPEIAL